MSTTPPRAPAAAALLAALLAAGALAGCGGGTDVSWCIGGDGFSAGYNTTHCPPKPNEKPAGPAP